jgi:hypothetical protein
MVLASVAVEGLSTYRVPAVVIDDLVPASTASWGKASCFASR